MHPLDVMDNTITKADLKERDKQSKLKRLWDEYQKIENDMNSFNEDPITEYYGLGGDDDFMIPYYKKQLKVMVEICGLDPENTRAFDILESLHGMIRGTH